MFLTSSTRGVVPIVRVEGKPIGDGRPGPITALLHGEYTQAMEQLAAED
jgi:branched-subunit amino acid aminotransferase/4-amino-4-deoxychorismate lyase